MAKHTLKILRCEHRKIIKVCLAILRYYTWRGSRLRFYDRGSGSRSFSFVLVLQKSILERFALILFDKHFVFIFHLSDTNLVCQHRQYSKYSMVTLCDIISDKFHVITPSCHYLLGKGRFYFLLCSVRQLSK